MFQREQQWHDEQVQILNAFKEIEEEMKKEVVTDSEKRYCCNVKFFILKNLRFKKSM